MFEDNAWYVKIVDHWIKPRLRVRSVKHWWQRRTRGWDDSETWSLDMSLAKLIAPRLKRFREVTKCRPIYMTDEEWDEILCKMIFAFEYCADEQSVIGCTEEIHAKVAEGLDLFAKHYRGLWW